MLQGEEEEEVVGQKLLILQTNCKLISFLFNSFRSKRYCERMKAKKQKAVQDIVHHDDLKIPKLNPLKANLQMKCNSFFCRQSTQVRKLLTNKPTTVIPILKHVWGQLYKDSKMRVHMNKYWKQNDEGSLAKLMLDIGKYRGRKYDKKLLVTVNKVKTKYNNLR